MQRSQHAKLLRKNKDSPRCTQPTLHKTTPAVRKDIQWFCVARAVRKDIHTSNFQLYAIPLAARKCYSDSLSDQIKQTTLDASTLAVRKDIQRSTLFQASAFLDHISLGYSSTTLYYKVLLLLCTTQCYSSTTLYYKVLLQYYSSTTLYYSWLIRGAAEMSLQHHQILRLPRKVTLIIDTLHTWDAIYNAWTNKCHCPNSPNTAPATKNESHDWSLSHMKRYLQCAEQQVSLSKLTKYCACHEKWISWLILVTHETLFTMRGATSVIVQTHQILRLPRKMTFQIFAKISRKQLKRHFQCGADPTMIRPWSDNDPRMIRPWNRHSATRLATEVTFHAQHEHFVLKNTTFRAPAIIPNFTEYCACHEKWHFNFTKYCACHEKWISWLILVTHETLFTMRGATSVIVQTHQILRLPCKMNLMIDPCHTWNAIYNARSNKCHCPNSPNTVPATQNDFPNFRKNFSKTAETSFPMRGRSDHDPRMIRPWSENDPTMKPSLRNPPRNRGYFSRPPRAFCIEKYNISRSGYHSKFHRILRLPRKVTLQLHQILRLPRKMTLMINPRHTWNAIYNARSNKCHCPNSPNTAPATKNESHDWSLSHMKRYLQCAEQQVSLSKLTKYCACHAKWLSKFSQKFLENSWNVISNAGPIRPWSENDPTMIREWSDHETVTPQPASQPRLLFTPTTSILYWKIQHFALRLSFQISPNTAPATKSDTSTSPNTAPATQNNSHDQSSAHMKRYLQCAEQQVSLSKLTKYCACHEKRISWLILVTHETLFTMRGATSVIVQTHQVLRLPRKMTFQIFAKISRKQLKRHFQCGADPTMIREWSDHDPRMIRPWSENDPTMKPSLRNPPRNRGYFSHHEHFVLKNTTFRAPAILPNFTEYCACHEKWHFNFTKYCACHAKWLSWSILGTHETLFTMRGGTSVIVQTHQILRLPRKMNLMIVTHETLFTVHATKSDTTLLYPTLLYYSLLFSYESNLRRIYFITNLISYESLLKRI